MCFQYLSKVHCLQSIGNLPDGDDAKAFYTLGVNVARQVGSELKGILTPEELQHMVLIAQILHNLTIYNLKLIDIYFKIIIP